MGVANYGEAALYDGMSLIEKVTKLMTERGLKQADLARMMGTTPQRVSLWMQGGKANPKVFHLVRLAKGLNVSLDYLLDDDMSGQVLTAGFEEDERTILNVYRSLKRLGGMTMDEAIFGISLQALKLNPKILSLFPDLQQRLRQLLDDQREEPPQSPGQRRPG